MIPPRSATESPRTRLAEIARREANLQLAGDPNQAGPAIEKYLSVFREALNANAETTRYSDSSLGYDWCAAFVYYCCREAGFAFPPKPLASARFTLGAVPAWQEWAKAEGYFHSPGSIFPMPGDIVLFNQVVSNAPLDHIGIVLETTQPALLCAEGNVENRTGTFQRNYEHVAGYIRLPQVTLRFGRFLTLLLILSPIFGGLLGAIRSAVHLNENSFWQAALGSGSFVFLSMMSALVLVKTGFLDGHFPWLEERD